MFFVNIPATYMYDLNEYSGVIKMMLSDRLASLEDFRDVYYWDSEIHTLDDAFELLIEKLGFNPINYYVDQFYYTGDEITSTLNRIISTFNLSANRWQYSNNNIINDCKIDGELIGYNFPSPVIATNTDAYCRSFVPSVNFRITKSSLNSYTFSFNFTAFPERYYENGVFNYDVLSNCGAFSFTVEIDEQVPSGYLRATRVIINKGVIDTRDSLAGYIARLDPSDVETENENPYSWGGASTIGGGDGIGVNPDEIEKILPPDLPDISALTTGLLTIFAPSLAQIQNLGDFLWSSAFDVDSLKKLFGNPMESIIGLGILPIKPILSGSKSVKIGNIDTGVVMPYINNQFVKKSCGSVSVNKYIGSFMDYSPYTNIQIYLPYIGVKSLSPDDVMNDTISVEYNVDVLTGGCACIISTSKKGVLYQYNGNCIVNVPLTAINYSGAIQNAVSAVGSIATSAIGMATGVAPLTIAGVTGLATSAANTAISSKPQIERSGNMGGSAGMLSVQRPYLIINRPNLSTPKDLNKFGGYPTNITLKLSEVTGFTMIDSIRLDNLPCTDNEKEELLTILKKGAIF